jgi:hypothetical protein
MPTLRSRRLSAGVAAALYALTGCALALSQHMLQSDSLVAEADLGCPAQASPERLVVALVDRLGLAQAMAARIGDLRYGPGPESRLASDGALGGLDPAPPPPVRLMGCGRPAALAGSYATVGPMGGGR